MLLFIDDIDSLNIGAGTPIIPTAAPELSPRSSLAPSSPGTVVGVKIPQTRAKVLYDYDAKDQTELSLISDEVS